jgi:hypothetical protein
VDLADADLRAAGRRILDYEPNPLADVAPGNRWVSTDRRGGELLEPMRVVRPAGGPATRHVRIVELM